MEHLDNYYIKCKYCGTLCKYGSNHMENCYPNWDHVEQQVKCCYSCGSIKHGFSLSQLNKKHLARCKNCIETGKNTKYARFLHLYKNVDDFPIELLDSNKQLFKAVYDLDTLLVSKLLLNGTNPNYCRQATALLWNPVVEWAYLYDENGNEIEEQDEVLPQPKTPLRLCVFMLSNAGNTEEDMDNIYNIAELLIRHGADKHDAVRYFRQRNGLKYEKYHSFYTLLSS